MLVHRLDPRYYNWLARLFYVKETRPEFIPKEGQLLKAIRRGIIEARQKAEEAKQQAKQEQTNLSGAIGIVIPEEYRQ